MTSLEKKNKRKGIIGTIIFHVLLFLTFMFLGLTYQDPPPPEEGISINFGFNDDGSNELETEKIEEKTEITEEIIEEQIENIEEIVTQSKIETAPIETKKEKQKVIEKTETKEDIIEEKKPEINKKAIYTGKKKSNKNSKENNSKTVTQGESDGDPNSNVFEGGGVGKDGMAYQLGGRKAINKPKPIGNQIQGRVVVLIIVDRIGNVIYANAGAQGSTTFNKELLKRAKNAALKTKFDIQKSAPEKQQGKIIYDFRLN